MTIFTFSEARQKLASILEKARKEGEVLIKKKDGSLFAMKPVSRKKSPLKVKGIKLDLSAEEIVELVREVRRR